MEKYDSHVCYYAKNNFILNNGLIYPCENYFESIDNINKFVFTNDIHKNEFCCEKCKNIQYNRNYMKLLLNNVKLNKIGKGFFIKESWGAGSLSILGISTRYYDVTSNINKSIIRKHAIGWIEADNIKFRPKKNHIAVMYKYNDILFWSHLMINEFIYIFS